MHVFFATPTYDKTVSVDHHRNLLDAIYQLSKGGVSWSTSIVAGNIFLDRARNDLVDQFLETDATDLLFVDADVGFDPQCLGRVLASKHAIVAGLVPKRDTGGEDVYHDNALTGVIDGGMFQALEAPTAFMRIKRSVFERLRDCYPDDVRSADEKFGWKHWPYFKMGDTKYGVIGEDIYFCRQWVALGQFIWIDPDITFAHRGSRVWKGNFYDYAVKSGLLIQESSHG